MVQYVVWVVICLGGKGMYMKSTSEATRLGPLRAATNIISTALALRILKCIRMGNAVLAL